jgi:hypothetical protein
MKRTQVIGDIHGCYREFKQLLDLCSDDADGGPARLITLSDYVDRGPDSFGVLQLIRHRLPKGHRDRLVAQTRPLPQTRADAKQVAEPPAA